MEYGTTGSGDSKLRFTRHGKDAATGLYVLFRRFYDPELGRSLSQGRNLGHLTVDQSPNPYVNTVNNSLRYVDPTGEEWWNPLTWGQDLSAAVYTPADASGKGGSGSTRPGGGRQVRASSSFAAMVIKSDHPPA